MGRLRISGGTVLAYEGGRHFARPGVDVITDGASIIHIGPGYDQPVDEHMDATDCLVAPGFVNAHLHVTDTAFTRGVLEDVSSSTQHVTTLYRYLPAIRNATAPEDALAAARATFAELLLSGSTTIVEMGYDEEIRAGRPLEPTAAVAQAAGECGLRVYIAPRYRSGFWRHGPAGPEYEWYRDRGEARMADCIAFCKQWDGQFNGRMRAMLAPGQVDTCERSVLQESRSVADATGFLIQLHAGQSPPEFRSIRERHGLDTVDFLDEVGLLGPDFIIGHGMFLSEDGNVDRIGAAALARLRESGTSIVALPWVKARQGGYMDSLQKFTDAGVNLGMGTDTHPFDMFNEMRMAAVMCKVAESDPGTGTAEHVFDIATAGGARALGRSDLGRIEVGAKADLLLIDVSAPHAQPMRDPFKFLVYSALSSDVRTVLVDGRVVVRDREILTMDVARAVREVRVASSRVWGRADV